MEVREQERELANTLAVSNTSEILRRCCIKFKQRVGDDGG